MNRAFSGAALDTTMPNDRTVRMNTILVPELIIFLIPYTFFGCASNADSNGSSSAERIAQYLAEQGYDVTDLAIEDEEVVVEGDMVFDFSTLENAASGIEEKAYTLNCSQVNKDGKAECTEEEALVNWRVDLDRVGHIKLVFDDDVSKEWRDLFIAAARQWSDATAFGMKQRIDIRTDNDGDKLRIKVDAIVSADGERNRKTVARAKLPYQSGSTIRVGNTIQLNSNFRSTADPCAGSIESVGDVYKMYVALHELGHTLGFVHPHDDRFYANENKKALQLVFTNEWTHLDAYSTVMRNGCLEIPTLQPDDVWTAVLYYFDNT